MYTLNRDDVNAFKGKIPEEVLLNCGEEGFSRSAVPIRRENL